jgi:hypothetical protein
MFCKKCGSEMGVDSEFCPHCGTPVAPPPGHEFDATSTKSRLFLFALAWGTLGVGLFLGLHLVYAGRSREVRSWLLRMLIPVADVFYVAQHAVWIGFGRFQDNEGLYIKNWLGRR